MLEAGASYHANMDGISLLLALAFLERVAIYVGWRGRIMLDGVPKCIHTIVCCRNVRHPCEGDTNCSSTDQWQWQQSLKR